MPLMKVFFSIIIPTYNRAEFLRSTILSVLKQSYTNFEIIIIDDGSTDNSQEVVTQINDQRVTYFWKENGERGAARNFGIKKSKGEYVTFLDSDDQLYPNHLEEAVSLIDQKNPFVFHLSYEIKDTDNRRKQVFKQIHGNLNELLLEGNRLSCMGVFLKREIALQHPFSEERRLSGSEDWLLWLQLAARYRFHYSNKITACMIQHADRSVMNFKIFELEDRTAILLKELKNDCVFLRSFGGRTIRKIEAHMYSYTALHLVLSLQKSTGLKYLLKALRCYPAELFQRRTLAILKGTIFLKNIS